MFSTPSWLRNDGMDLHYSEKKSQGFSRFIQTLKSCLGYGFDDDAPRRSEYQRSRDPATGFEGEEVYGIQAEYLDEDDMAWGKPKKSSRKRAKQRHHGAEPDRAFCD